MENSEINIKKQNDLKNANKALYKKVSMTIRKDTRCFYPQKVNGSNYEAMSEVMNSVDEFIFTILLATMTNDCEFVFNEDHKQKLTSIVADVHENMEVLGRKIKFSTEKTIQLYSKLIMEKQIPDFVELLLIYDKKHKSHKSYDITMNILDFLKGIQVKDFMNNSALRVLDDIWFNINTYVTNRLDSCLSNV